MHATGTGVDLNISYCVTVNAPSESSIEEIERLQSCTYSKIVLAIFNRVPYLILNAFMQLLSIVANHGASLTQN